jgi:hypothetical protein
MAKTPTYINPALNHQSIIDYILISSQQIVADYVILDLDINFSDHLPLLGTFELSGCKNKVNEDSGLAAAPVQLRWDHADTLSYYQYSGHHLQPVLYHIDNVINQFDKRQLVDYNSVISLLHDDIVNILACGAKIYIPHCKKNFFKFWWDEELNLLKEASIESNQIWKAAGKPRHGPIFNKRQSCRLQYRSRIRDGQKATVTSYTNDLHDSLLSKNGPAFWKCWRSKFESPRKCVGLQVDGCVDKDTIADKFAQHFSKSYSCTNANRAADLCSEYQQLRANYCGMPLTNESLFDTELVSKVIDNLKRGKAAGLDGLTAEHLTHSHPILPCVLSRLFNLILLSGHVPAGFGHSYTVPIPKPKDCRTKAMTCDDFRGIAISSILSKVFEHCILERFSKFLYSADNQFGFKKGVGTSHAIYTVRRCVDRFVKGGSTVNLCALDLSKAFDKMNHNALFIKLMKRLLPVELLTVLEHWFLNCFSCIKWDSVMSNFFKINSGVRQGSVLSPILFAIFINDIVDTRLIGHDNFIILYADDIMLLAPSVCELQRLLNICERELAWLDMSINGKKSSCMRIGTRNDRKCEPIFTAAGYALAWVNEIRYLGVSIVQSRQFKCSLAQAKRAFYRSVNAVFGKIGRVASEEVTLHLVVSKCLPILLYGTEACPLIKSDLTSLDFVVTRFLMKLFKTNNIEIVNTCRHYFDVIVPSSEVKIRTNKFIAKYRNCPNVLCKIFSSVV